MDEMALTALIVGSFTTIITAMIKLIPKRAESPSEKITLTANQLANVTKFVDTFSAHSLHMNQSMNTLTDIQRESAHNIKETSEILKEIVRFQQVISISVERLSRAS